MPQQPDYTGERIGRYTCIGKAEVKGKKRLWIWRCDCGKETISSHHDIAKQKHHACRSCARRGFDDTKLPTYRRAWYAVLRRHKAKGFSRETCIPLEDFVHLVTQPCIYCGRPPERVRKAPKHIAYAEDIVIHGLDRIDSDRGYEIENVVPCCFECNASKGVMSYFEFMDHVRLIYEHNHLGDTKGD